MESGGEGVKLTVVVSTLVILLGVPAMAVEAAELPPPRTVEDLMATYGWMVDRHDGEGVRRLFVDDATLVAPVPDTTVNGLDAIMDLLTDAWSQQPDTDRKRRHLITGVRAYAKRGDQVEFFATFGVVGTPDSGPSKAYNSGYYQGVAEMTDSGLKFRRLVIGVD
jgi:hypothetical protein